MAHKTREYTCKTIEAVKEGWLTWENVARAALNYMSESDVEDMANSEQWFPGGETYCDEAEDD